MTGSRGGVILTGGWPEAVVVGEELTMDKRPSGLVHQVSTSGHVGSVVTLGDDSTMATGGGDVVWRGRCGKEQRSVAKRVEEKEKRNFASALALAADKGNNAVGMASHMGWRGQTVAVRSPVGTRLGGVVGLATRVHALESILLGGLGWLGIGVALDQL
jgi:hypothetical protein